MSISTETLESLLQNNLKSSSAKREKVTKNIIITLLTFAIIALSAVALYYYWKRIPEVNLVSLTVQGGEKGLPLKRLMPFVINLKLEAKNLSDITIADFCNQLVVLSDNFIVRHCQPVDYTNNTLQIEMAIESKNAGDQILKIGLKNNKRFNLTGTEVHSLVIEFATPPVKLISVDIIRENKQAPLKRLTPYSVKLTFEAEGLSESQINDLCKQLISATENFTFKECRVINYQNKLLQIEVIIEGNQIGEQVLKVALKDNNSFQLLNDQDKYFKGIFVTPVKLNSIVVSKENNELLKQLVPFKAGLRFETENLSKKEINDFCEHITATGDNFVLSECKPVSYKDNVLEIETKVESKYPGKQILKINLKDSNAFSLEEGNVDYEGIFLTPIKLTSINVPQGKNAFPLKRLTPFVMDMAFETKHLSEAEIQSLCRQLIILG